MVATTTRVRPDRRNSRHITRAVSTVALAAALVLGSAAIAPASAVASEYRGTGQDTAAAAWTFIGPLPSYTNCATLRAWYQNSGYSTTPCFLDPDGWYFQVNL